MHAPLFIVLVLVLGLTGCPANQKPLPAKCTKLHEQCALPSAGPLGVCNATDCLPGQSPPCLKCVGQH